MVVGGGGVVGCCFKLHYLTNTFSLRIDCLQFELVSSVAQF